VLWTNNGGYVITYETPDGVLNHVNGGRARRLQKEWITGTKWVGDFIFVDECHVGKAEHYYYISHKRKL
ncbi:MAG: hypothetical protein ACRC5M_02550, partial [Anaeroplasmataceae bacterium]